MCFSEPCIMHLQCISTNFHATNVAGATLSVVLRYLCDYGNMNSLQHLVYIVLSWFPENTFVLSEKKWCYRTMKNSEQKTHWHLYFLLVLHMEHTTRVESCTDITVATRHFIWPGTGMQHFDHLAHILNHFGAPAHARSYSLRSGPEKAIPLS